MVVHSVALFPQSGGPLFSSFSTEWWSTHLSIPHSVTIVPACVIAVLSQKHRFIDVFLHGESLAMEGMRVGLCSVSDFHHCSSEELEQRIDWQHYLPKGQEQRFRLGGSSFPALSFVGNVEVLILFVFKHFF